MRGTLSQVLEVETPRKTQEPALQELNRRGRAVAFPRI